ncbi:nitrogen regulation protein NR(II), partial [Chlamydiota bacterium]
QESERLEAAYAGLRTQFHDLKEKWEASHQTLQQLIAYMSDGLMFVSKEGTITLFNPAASALLGVPTESVLQRPCEECFSDHLFGFSMHEALTTEGSHQRIFLTLCEEKEIEVSTSPVPGKGILLLLSNRTEQQKLQKSLSQAERLQELGEMAATLAHEIRNPLGGIEGFARLLKRDLEVPAHQRMISAILDGTRTLNSLVSQVLDYAKPHRLHFAPTNLVALVQEACSLAQVSQADVLYRFHSAFEDYTVSLDRERIKLVLLNLLRNAKEAGATSVDIALTETGTLVVKDNGSGISPKNLHKIFTPFFTTKARGTGLGLAASLAVIKAHGGKLEVSSEEGKGTQFTLTLQ